MYKFFKHCKMHDVENISEERLAAIKSSVLSRVNQSEEELPMKKHFSIKPLLIAAAVSATAVASLATANAATDGAVMDGISKTFTFMLNGNEVDGEFITYATSDGNNVEELILAIPDDAADNMHYEITAEVDGWTVYTYICNEDGSVTAVDENGNVAQVPAPTE